MGKRSFVYRNIFIYRFVMNILYLGKYKSRFNRVIQHIKAYPTGIRVLELCFGDIYLAEFCKATGYSWTGLDINTDFVNTAKKRGFDARQADLKLAKQLPEADVCVMMGSLYHFHSQVDLLLSMMFQASQTVVLSEPVSNLSSRKNWIGLLARRAANAGNGHEVFRYNKRSFLDMLEDSKKKIGFGIEILQDNGKDMIVKLHKDENH